jgi:hypothetical protein
MAFYQMNISTKNKVALMIALALGLGLTFNYFYGKSNSLPFKLEPIAKLDPATKNKYKLPEYTHEKIDELNNNVSKIKLTSSESSPSCDAGRNVLPVRLTISRDNRIKSFGSYISEDYLFMTLEERSYDCESIKFYFSLEDGVTDDYLNQLIAKIDKLKTVQVYSPAIIHAPRLPLIL